MVEPSSPEESIFAQAVEVSPAERPALLDRVCGADPALRAAVEALLRANDCSGDLLDLPDTPAVTVGEPAAREGPGTALGPYKLLEEIGAGGFGLVFVAEQQHPV